MKQFVWIRAVLVVAGIGVALASAGAGAATYKWTDEKGVVHYTDKMPPEAVDRASVQMTKDGIPVKKTDPALTAEQRRAREQDEERRRQASREQEEVSRRDRALLASYTSEGEIDLARARAIGTIDAVMQSSKSYIEQLEKRKGELTQKIADARASAKPIPAVYERELDNLNQELARQAELIAAKRREMTAITSKYEADKLRFHELKAQGATLDAPRGNAGANAAARR